MNKISTKVTVIILCAAMCLSGVFTAFALTGDKNENTQTKSTDKSVYDSLAGEIPEAYKDETVYVLSSADGSVNKIIVSDWLKNVIGADSLTDSSDLYDIENLNGDEEFTSKNGSGEWKADGKDIYYQGSIDKELPVKLTVSYKLDGKEITPEKIAGKSGKVVIRFDYENKQYENVEIDGKEEKIYVPFAVITGMILDNETFRNVEVTNGKLINDGDRMLVVGAALPGMQENLGIDKDIVEIPDYVEISADASDFSFGMTVTLATNELFNRLDTSKLDSADGIKDSIGELADGMTKLLDGSSELYNGISTLLEKSKELIAGIEKLTDGAKAVSDGTATLDDGAKKLLDGAAELSDGLNTLKANNSALTDGAKQVFETLLSTAESQIKAGGISLPSLTIDNYADVLNKVIASLDKTAVYNEALTTVTSAVEANRPTVKAKVTEAVRAGVEAQVTEAVRAEVVNGVTAAVRGEVTEKVIASAAGMSRADYENAVSAGMIPEETQNAVNAAIDNQMQTDDVKMLIESNVAAKMQSDEIKATVKANTDATMQTEAIQKTVSDNVEIQIKQLISENMASDAVQSKLTAASEGAKSIISLKASLDGYNVFYLGLLTYTDGVSAAADGAVQLLSGATELSNGTATLRTGTSALYDGILTLKNSTPALTDGVSKLHDGAKQLSDGLNKFNEEGIQKIVDLLEGDLDTVAKRLSATIDVSKNYRNFSGISDKTSGQVKFIYRTDEIN